MLRTATILTICALIFPALRAAGPSDTDYTYQECAGSASPYARHFEDFRAPDSLKVVMVNHVGRHGARYPSSSANCEDLARVLHQAENTGMLTEKGRKLLELTEYVIEQSAGRWGQLDSLGIAEQRGIAARMYVKYNSLFGKEKTVTAIASFKPRCVLSMYEFMHQLSLLAPDTKLLNASGPQESGLLRFFESNKEYQAYRGSDALKEALRHERDRLLAEKPACAVGIVGEQLADRDVAMAMYGVVIGAGAMEIAADPSQWFSKEEYNSLWALKNLKQYLEYSYSTLSSVPAEMAAPLVRDLIAAADRAAAGEGPFVVLRFGHAETLMPLLSLLRVKGAYYISDRLGSVARHWHNYHLVPMAANLQMILFEAPSGKKYVRFDLNEIPQAMMPGSEEIYVEWDKMRSYLLKLLPREAASL